MFFVAVWMNIDDPTPVRLHRNGLPNIGAASVSEKFGIRAARWWSLLQVSLD